MTIDEILNLTDQEIDKLYQLWSSIDNANRELFHVIAGDYWESIVVFFRYDFFMVDFITKNIIIQIASTHDKKLKPIIPTIFQRKYPTLEILSYTTETKKTLFSCVEKITTFTCKPNIEFIQSIRKYNQRFAKGEFYKWD